MPHQSTDGAIVAEAERLHWRTAGPQTLSSPLSAISKFMHIFKCERGNRTMAVPSRKLWHALRELNDYVWSQTARDDTVT